jgi:hypothetical protein
MEKSIHDALATAKFRLQMLQDQRAKIDREIAEWKRVFDSLSAVTEDVPDDVILADDTDKFPLKFTDAIRLTLSLNRDAALTAPLIRDILIRHGFDFSRYKQELVPIHNTLKRLVEQGEAAAVTDEGGQIAGYKYVDPIQRVLSQDPTQIVVRRKRLVRRRRQSNTETENRERAGKVEAALNAIEERFGKKKE